MGSSVTIIGLGVEKGVYVGYGVKVGGGVYVGYGVCVDISVESVQAKTNIKLAVSERISALIMIELYHLVLLVTYLFLLSKEE